MQNKVLKMPKPVSAALSHAEDLTSLQAIRPALARRIRADHPHLEHDSNISAEQLAEYRTRYVTELLQAERGELTKLDEAVAASLAKSELIAANTDDTFEGKRTFGEKLSDNLAKFGGSWMFLICFGAALAIWIAYNAARGENGAFDPFPFILLNLILSCLAAVQAPVIMMSQRRQETKDRLRARNDYQINLKAELEIRHLHEKVDHLLNSQWQRLAKLQELQIKMLEEIRDGKAARRARPPK
jgi:uncharacterized membrane protein